MNKTKKILISVSIALVILCVISYILNVKNDSNYTNIPVAVKSANRGQKIEVKWIKSILDKSENDIKFVSKEDIASKVANTNIASEQIITDKLLVSKEELLAKHKDKLYVAIPITNASNGVCYQIKVGDTVNVYYTAKRKVIDGVIGDKTKIFSTNNSDSMVTCKLFENIKILSVYNNVGQETKDNVINNVIVELSSEDVMLLANLKEQGNFVLAIS